MLNTKHLLFYFIITVILLILDFIWLGFLSRNFYKQEIGHLLAEKAKIIPALIFYLSYPVGLLIFVINPNLDGSLIKTLFLGALFGFFCYATYDLTNYATLKDWPLKVVLVDILWGMFISGTTASLTQIIINRLKLHP